MKLNEDEKKVLGVLASAAYDDDYGGLFYSHFDGLTERTGIDRKAVRLACRSLARKGLAEYGKGLWTPDGEPAGAGYRATQAGADLMLEIEKQEEEERRKVACPNCAHFIRNRTKEFTGHCKAQKFIFGPWTWTCEAFERKADETNN
jgi:hypothetical protein